MKARLDGRSFLLGALAGTLVVFTLGILISFLVFQRAAAPTTFRGKPGDATVATQNVVEGVWFNTKNPRNPCSITSTPNGLYVTDQNGATSRLVYDPAGFVTATDWRGGLEGEVQNDTIRWANGAVWVRTPTRTR